MLSTVESFLVALVVLEAHCKDYLQDFADPACLLERAIGMFEEECDVMNLGLGVDL